MAEVTGDALLAQVQAVVAAYGWAVQHVAADANWPGYAHTVGLTVRSLPELVVTGLPGPASAHVLNHFATLAVTGRLVIGGRLEVMVGDTLRGARVVVHEGGLCVVAAALYGAERVRAVEVVLDLLT